jgi:hypothetical protein
MSRFELKNNDNDKFKKNFAVVKPRSSHSLCECDGYVYILGGYCQNNQEEQTVERVNILNGAVEKIAKSIFSGPSIAFSINGSILKASNAGVEIYSPPSKTWQEVATSSNYQFLRSSGWTKISTESILVYGGYESESEVGVDECKIWTISEATKELKVKPLSCRLPERGGFSSAQGIIVGKMLYAIQDALVEDSATDSVVINEERTLLCFNAKKWELLQ